MELLRELQKQMIMMHAKVPNSSILRVVLES